MYLGGNRRWVPLLFIILARNIDCKSILQKPLKQFGQVASKYKRKSRYKSRAIFSAFLFTPCTGIRNPGSGKFLLVESGMQLKESRIPLRIGIQVPLTKTGIQCLESTIHGVES